MIELTTRTLAPSNTLVMEIGGRADSTASSFLIDCIEGYIESGFRNVIIDCSDLQMISSECLGELVRANKLHGVSLSLVGVPGRMAEILRITHLGHLFNIFDSVDEANEAMQTAASH